MGGVAGKLLDLNSDPDIEGIPIATIRGDHNGVVVGESSGIRQVKRQIDRVANYDVPVLLIGETGTGKELAARMLHFNGMRGRRGDKPFVVGDCTSIPQGLEESILFGHEKGAFTGADKPSKGLVREADSGTLFLDEIGELAVSAQGKLLRLLQEREVRPLGNAQPIKVDVRIVAATNKDLFASMENGSFKHDLFYRLAVVPIIIPPLRQRPEDIPHMVKYYLKAYNREFNGAVTLSQDASDLLEKYSWPGNVRELQSVLMRAVLFKSQGEIGVDELLFDDALFPAARGQRKFSTAVANDARPWYAGGAYPVPLHELRRLTQKSTSELEAIISKNANDVYTVTFGNENQTRIIYLSERNVELFTGESHEEDKKRVRAVLSLPMSDLCMKPHRLYNVPALLKEPEAASPPTINRTLEKHPELILYAKGKRRYFAVPADQAHLFVGRGENWEANSDSLRQKIIGYHNTYFMPFGS